jgi:hypothetical protein
MMTGAVSCPRCTAKFGPNKSGDRRSRHHSSSESSRSRSPPRKERRKSMGEELIASLGLGGAVGALLGKKDKDNSRSPSRNRSRSRAGTSRRARSEDRSRSRGPKGRSKSIGKEQIVNALKAAALAGAGAAIRARKEPGGWSGEKGKRVMTAAITAAGVDGLISNKKDPEKHSNRDVIGSALAGMATNRLLNGARSKSRGRGSPDRRGRSESHGRGLGELAAGGALVAAGKKAYDSWRGRSKSRGRSRSSSYDSEDSRRSRRNKRRSQSVSGYAAKGLAALGLNSAADKVDPARQRDTRRYDDNYVDDRSSRYGPPGNGYGYSDNRDVGFRPRDPGAMSATPSTHTYSFDSKPHHTGDPETDSDSDLGSSSEDEKERKKSRRKGVFTAGLATVATIHAAHSIYQAKEKRDANRKLLAEGDISPEEAKKRKNKMRLQEAAAIGIAGLGLKGAYSEWKETKEAKHELRESEEKSKRHAEKREARRRKYEEENQLHYGGQYTSSMPDLRMAGQGFAPPPLGKSYSAAHYYDDNPYASFNAPPMPDPNFGHFPPPPTDARNYSH